MRIVQTILVNCCQHERLKVKFAPGLVGLFGHNGVGKSNLLKMGAYANLTNDFSRNNKPKSENVRYLAGKDDPAYIETEWEHDGHDFVLVRGLQNPKRDTLRSSLLEKPLHKDGEIDEWLGKLLGTPNYKYLADNYVFIAQGDLAGFLSEDAATRAKGYAHLCGTTVAETCWKAVGDQITKDAPLTSEVVDNSDDLRRVIGEHRTTIEDCERKTKKWAKRKLPQKEVETLRASLDSVVRRRELLRQLKSAKAELETSLAAHKASKEKRAGLWADYKTKKLAAEQASKRLLTVRVKLQTLDERKKTYDAKRRIERDLAGLREPERPTKSEYTAEAIKEKEVALAELERELKKAQKIDNNIRRKKVVECPECGTLVDSIHGHLERQQEIMRTYPPVIEEARKTLRKMEAGRNDWDGYRAERRSYDERFDLLTRQLREYADVEAVPDTERETLRSREQKYQGIVAAAEAAHEAWSDERESSIEAHAGHKANVKLVLSLRKDLKAAAAASAETDAKAVRQRLADHDNAVKWLAVYKERATNAEKAIAGKQTELETLEKRIAQTARMREWLKLLQEMRAVLHREKLPKIVHEAYQEQLLPDANELLAKFRHPFVAEAKPNLVFGVTKPDGTLENADCLSGGEQAVFALAIRWAVHSLSAAGLGMLVLDEPTAGLDEANMSYLRDALPQLGAEARSRGLQVIVVTHENMLKPVFDQVIELR